MFQCIEWRAELSSVYEWKQLLHLTWPYKYRMNRFKFALKANWKKNPDRPRLCENRGDECIACHHAIHQTLRGGGVKWKNQQNTCWQSSKYLINQHHQHENINLKTKYHCWAGNWNTNDDDRYSENVTDTFSVVLYTPFDGVWSKCKYTQASTRAREYTQTSFCCDIKSLFHSMSHTRPALNGGWLFHICVSSKHSTRAFNK